MVAPPQGKVQPAAESRIHTVIGASAVVATCNSEVPTADTSWRLSCRRTLAARNEI